MNQWLSPLRPLLAALIVLTLVSGCGGSGGGAGAGQTVTFAATPSASPITPPAGPNRVTGTVTTLAKRKVPPVVYVALLQGETTVGRQVLDGSGGFSFPALADGSYQIVVSGQGFRTQSDTFNVRSGSIIRLAYTLSDAGSAPSDGEAKGLVTQALRYVRGMSGYRALPLAAQSALDFNRRRMFNQVPPGKRTHVAPNVIAIPVPGAHSIAVDRTGTAWVSTNDSIFDPGDATHAGVVQISTSASVVGAFATAAAANSGGGVVGVNDALDVALYNLELDSLCTLPRGESNIAATSVTGTAVSVTAIAGQRIPTAPSLSRFVVVGQTSSVAALGFLSGTGSLVSATLPGAIPSNLVILGACVDPADQSIYLSGHEPTLNGPAHLYHLTADGTGLIEDVNLGSFRLFGVQNLARDANGAFWMAASSNLVRVSGAQGSRTVTVIPAVHADSSPFSLASAIAVDQNAPGRVWVTDQGSNNVTAFDLSGTALTTLNTADQPVSVAVDSQSNVWIACEGPFGHEDQAVVNEVVVGGVVPPDTQVQTYVAPSGRQVTVSPGPTQSSLLQAFPQSTYTEAVTIFPTVAAGGTTTRTEAVLVSGPTLVSQSAQYASGTYNVSGTATDARSGQPTQYTGVFQANGVGEFSAFTPAGQISVRYTAAPGGGGRIAMESTITEHSEVAGGPQIVTWQVTATCAADGSISEFRVSSNASDLAVRGSMSVNGELLAEIFNVNAPATRYSSAQSASTLSVLNALVETLAQSIPLATPTTQGISTMFQSVSLPSRSPYMPGPTPGYSTLIVTYPGGATDTVEVPIATTTLPANSSDVNDATPPSQTLGSADSGGQTVPANQGISIPFDSTGQAILEIAAVGLGSTGLEKTGPIRHAAIKSCRSRSRR